MALTRSFKELVEKQAASDPAFAEALRREEANTMTPARVALLAFAKAWTYPILGNEDVPVMRRLFDDARALSKGVPRARPIRRNSRVAGDPRDKSRDSLR